MRRACATVLIIFTLFAATALGAFMYAAPQRLAIYGGESYRFYVGDTSKNCREVRASAASAPLVRLTLCGVQGECAEYSSLDVDEFLKDLGAEVIFCEETANSVNYYCSAPLPYSITLYGKEINLHVCVKESGVMAASPIIFGGY